MEGSSSSETLVPIYQTTSHYATDNFKHKFFFSVLQLSMFQLKKKLNVNFVINKRR
jgi:hypothetical protein